MKETIEVPRAWLEHLVKYAQRTSEAIPELTPEEMKATLKVGASELAGYASSAEAMLKL